MTKIIISTLAINLLHQMGFVVPTPFFHLCNPHPVFSYPFLSKLQENGESSPKSDFMENNGIFKSFFPFLIWLVP